MDTDTTTDHRRDEVRERRSRVPWIIGIIAAVVLAIVLFFALGGDADVDGDPGDIDVEMPEVDADIDAPEIDLELPDVDVDPGSVDVDEGDADADVDG